MKDPKRKGRDNMVAPVKPVRKTEVEFDNDVREQEFLNYAFSTKKSNSPGLKRVRELLKRHKRAKEIK